MGKADIENGKRQAEEFKEEYGEYPVLPIRISYRWMSTRAIGDLAPTRFGGYSIFGFPGMVNAGDEEVSDVLFLYDAEGRLFPNVTEEICGEKPIKRSKRQ